MLFKKYIEKYNELEKKVDMINDVLTEISNNNQKEKDIISSEIKTELKNLINNILDNKVDSILENIKIEIYKNNQELSKLFLDTLQSNLENNLKSNLESNLESNLKNNLQIKQELLENWKTNDLSLRNDLQTFLLGLQKDIIYNLCSQTNLAIEQTKELKSSILLVNEQVNKFYYENEIVKHQLLLEQDIRNYNDEIESIKMSANNLKNTIDDILKNYDFE